MDNPAAHNHFAIVKTYLSLGIHGREKKKKNSNISPNMLFLFSFSFSFSFFQFFFFFGGGRGVGITGLTMTRLLIRNKLLEEKC